MVAPIHNTESSFQVCRKGKVIYNVKQERLSSVVLNLSDREQPVSAEFTRQLKTEDFLVVTHGRRTQTEIWSVSIHYP